MKPGSTQARIYTIKMNFDDLSHPFKDFREDKTLVRTIDEQRFSNKDLFYYLIDETERTFKSGMIVSATVSRVQNSKGGNNQAKIFCRLENGLDAFINQDCSDFTKDHNGEILIDVGSIVTGRVDEIKFGENEERFSVMLNCK